MNITFDVSHVFNPDSPQEQNADALGILLDCLVRLNRAYLRDHTAKALYQSGVVYGRTGIWEPIPALYKRGYGDCKSLTGALIAEMQEHGIPARPVFRWRRRPEDRGYDFHILVMTQNGFVDPSKRLGMGQDELRWFLTPQEMKQIR